MKRSAMVAAAILVLIFAGSFIGGANLASYANTIDEVSWQGTPQAPCFQDAAHCGAHVLGTDENGRDVAARLLTGGRVTLTIALLAVLLDFGIAAVLALLARSGGHVLDATLRTLAEGLSALPRVPFLLALTAVAYAIFGKDVAESMLFITVSRGAVLWPQAMLVLRSGANRASIVSRALLDAITIVLAGVAIDFFGFGVQPPTPTWGNMLANGESNMEIAWWVVVFPGLCLVVTVLLLDIVRRGLPPTTKAACAARPQALP